MRILVIGSGGREHTLVWKISQSKKVEKIFCIPGNAGISEMAECINISLEKLDEIVKFAKENKIDLTVVGPEKPLADGIVDLFRENGLKIIGPDKKASTLECSKSFAKLFMKKYNIPTAKFEIFDDYENAINFVDKLYDRPFNNFWVVKADGLCAGKGVTVCNSIDEMKDAIEDSMVKKKFGSAGEKIVIEEKLEGEEASLMAFCDGKNISLMVSSQDHKRVFDNDKGPNTGGMGAYAPACVVTKKVLNQAKEKIFKNFLAK
ncbi:MAG: phosphoribosylamine--glycine ligase [Endomicrobiia bacterium]